MASAFTQTSRKRIWIFLATAAVILFGLASRKYPKLFPAMFGSYLGDALWAAMVYLLLAWLRPRAPVVHLAAAALTVSLLIEASQLYQAPWIVTLRSSTLGHLMLGMGFQWLDMLAYAIGIALIAALDALLARRRHLPA